MTTADTDRAFTGSIPALYDELMVPMIFEPYAQDVARRVATLAPGRVLEVAAGTGVVTRAISALLPDATMLVATDLNPSMMAQAEAVGTRRPVSWRQADAQALPFADESFDVVVCQFGAMFFPEKVMAFAEARRVLVPGGRFLFSVWNGLENNEFADSVNSALAAFFADDPPQFMARTPHGYHDPAVIQQHLEAAGFSAPAAFETITHRSHSASAKHAAVAYCQGTPMRNEILSRGADLLDRVTAATASALAARFGVGPIEGSIQGQLVTATR